MLAGVNARPVARVGPFSILNATAVPREQSRIELSAFRAYPPLEVSFTTAKAEIIDLSAYEGRYLAITHIGFAMGLRPQVSLSCGFDRLIPEAIDNVSWLFELPDCDADLILEVTVSNPDHIDVAIF
ncbi:MAG: hypothetical protein AAF446_02390 [Pseudomonadota bacterium]